MGKMCLCFKPRECGPFFENWDFFMADRDIVDDLQQPDPKLRQVDPETQQLISYVTFYRALETSEGADPVYQLLKYTRGKESGEQRLAGNSSVGFGGHKDKMPEGSVITFLQEEISREIREELGIELNQRALEKAILTCLRTNNFLCVNDGTVNCVHTGLAILLCIDDHLAGQEFVLEQGHIEGLEWIDPLQVCGNEEQMGYYETWSKMVIGGIAKKLNEMNTMVEEARALQERMMLAQQSNHLPHLEEDRALSGGQTLADNGLTLDKTGPATVTFPSHGTLATASDLQVNIPDGVSDQPSTGT